MDSGFQLARFLVVCCFFFLKRVNKTNAGQKTSLPGQEAYQGLRVHYAEA